MKFDPGGHYFIHQLPRSVISQAADSITLFMLILAISLLPVMVRLFAGLSALFE